MGVIYKATCLDTNRSYIGQTIRPLSKRIREHEKATDNYAIHSAIRKYGKDNFIWEIIEECLNENLDEREKYWIAFYDTYYNGYNETKGGDNANSLLNWKEGHKEEELKMALNGLKYAQQHNKEHREEHLKQLEKVREKARLSRSQKVCCIELNLIFNSLSEAETWSQTKENPNGKHCHHQHISKVCRGQRKTAGGYHWKYI